MRKTLFILFVLLVSVLNIPCHLLAQEIFLQDGIASWYGKEYEGRLTASGEIYDPEQLTAAHPNLPFGTIVVVTNQHNNKKVMVRINDRGPFVSARIIDVSKAAAEQLDMIVTGTAPVFVESIDVIEIPKHINIVETQATVVYTSQPVVVQVSNQIRITPQLNVLPSKTYRFQLGSYKIAKNAVDTFDKLKNNGFNPSYERFINNENEEYFRVVLAGISGSDVQLTTEKLGAAGFKEALIREEN